MNSSAKGDRPDNAITGSIAGNAVQAGAIHGGLHWHQGTGTTTPVPRQLKPPPAHFIARTTELADLDRIAEDPERHGPALAVISGQGGVGKSALALRWLHAALDRYPDGQLYADLAIESSAASVLSQFIRAFGVPSDQVPAELAEAAALFRSLTAGRRLAILVENATSAAEVRGLLPASPGSVVVVATRWRLGGLAMDGAEFLSLSPLSTASGAELIALAVGRARVDKEPEAAAQLVELCAGLPIALAIAAARLATRPGWPVSRVVRDLTDEQRRLAALSIEHDLSVHGVFDFSSQSLAPREGRAYRQLGLCPAPSFTADIAAAALELPVDDAADVLDALVDTSLLETDGERYRFHDLLRLHARGLGDANDDPHAVAERTTRYFLRFASGAARRIYPLERRLGPTFPAGDHPTEIAALDAVEAELTNLLAVLRAGAAHQLDELVWQLCEAMYALFLRRKHFPDWLATYELGIAAAQRCGDLVAESLMRVRLGIGYHNIGRYDDAVDAGATAAAAASAAGNAWTESKALQLIGMANRHRGHLDDAVAALRASIELDDHTGGYRDEAVTRRMLGQTFIELNRLDDAIDELSRARVLAGEDTHVEANIMVWLADALSRTGNPAEAVTLLENAWDALRESGSHQHQAQVLMVWGWVAERDGDLLAAQDLLTRAHDRYVEINAPHVARLRGDLARVTARLTE